MLEWKRLITLKSQNIKKHPGDHIRELLVPESKCREGENSLNANFGDLGNQVALPGSRVVRRAENKKLIPFARNNEIYSRNSLRDLSTLVNFMKYFDVAIVTLCI